MTLSNGTNEVLASPAARKMASEPTLIFLELRVPVRAVELRKRMY